MPVGPIEPDDDEDKPTKKEPFDWRGFLIKFIPFAGTFTGLLYFLGRLHLEAYYSALHINPSALSFTTNDYMFSSFDLLIVLIMASFFLVWIYKTKTEKKDKKNPARLTERKRNVSMIFILLVVEAIIWTILLITPYKEGLSAFLAGIALGTLYLIYFLYYLILPASKNLLKKVKLTTVTAIFFVCLICMLPGMTTILATNEAKGDMQNFPYISITTNNPLPTQLQLSPTNPNESVKTQLLTVNNGKAYLYLLNENNKDEEFWEIITVPGSDIKTIVYYDPKLQEQESK